MTSGTKAIFLDVGGTLLDLGDPGAAYADILDQYGYPSTREQIGTWIRKAQEETGPVVSSGYGSEFKVSAEKEQARREVLIAVFLREAGVRKHFDSCRKGIWDSWVNAPAFHLFPETIPMLQELKESGFLVGAVSNWEPRLQELCENLGIAHYFDFMVVSEAHGYAKPGIRLFELALERAGTRPEETIHVGNDPVEDIEPAELLGIRAVLIQRGGSDEIHHSPRISSLNEVLPLARARAWLRGRVVSGKGEAAAFTKLPWVQKQAAGGFHFEPYPGTLNLQLEGDRDREVWKELRSHPGKTLEPETGYCSARCYPVSVEGRIAGAIVLPEVSSESTDVVEVLAPVNLRDALKLGKGVAVTIALFPPVA